MLHNGVFHTVSDIHSDNHICLCRCPTITKDDLCFCVSYICIFLFFHILVSSFFVFYMYNLLREKFQAGYFFLELCGSKFGPVCCWIGSIIIFCKVVIMQTYPKMGAEISWIFPNYNVAYVKHFLVGSYIKFLYNNFCTLQ